MAAVESSAPSVTASVNERPGALEHTSLRADSPAALSPGSSEVLSPHAQVPASHAPASPLPQGAPATALYLRVAADLERAMLTGVLRTGDRLPSVRELCRRHAVSASTATQAYRSLENRALVEARPKSGYFVAPRRAPLPEPELDPRMGSAGFVTNDEMTRAFLVSADDPDALPSFCTMASASLLPQARLQQITAHVNRLHPEYASSYHIGGSLALRQELARRSLGAGAQLRPEEILITNGGTEALFLALRAAARPGDTIAVESPTYFMMLEIIGSLGMRSLEIPTHPRDGISLEALDLATRKPGTVRACMVTPNFQNPIGSLMPEEHKRRLVAMSVERGFTLIESDVYGETHFGPERPPVLRSFDPEADVILCSSVSKTVAPGYRVGWMAPGRHLRAAKALKCGISLASPRLPQEVIARFLQSGGYEHHMRRLRAALREQSQRLADAVTRHFPPGCRLSRPQGGLILWIELPQGTDGRRVFEQARLERIGVAPGATFSCSGRFDHFIRLNYGEPWTPKLDARIRRLGEIVSEHLPSRAAFGG